MQCYDCVRTCTSKNIYFQDYFMYLVCDRYKLLYKVMLIPVMCTRLGIWCSIFSKPKWLL